MAYQTPHTDQDSSMISQLSSTTSDNAQKTSSSSWSAEAQLGRAQSLLKSKNTFASDLEPLKKSPLSLSLAGSAEGRTSDDEQKTVPTDVVKCKRLLADFLDDFILGRDEVRERLVNYVLSYDRKQHDVSMVLVVADSGMGKTTLSRLVYNDPLVRKNFDVQGWISEPHINDETGFLKAVIESITGISCRLCGLSELKEVVKVKLASKRFLLVVDEIWNDECMTAHGLLESLSFGRRGSVILVTSTTRKIENSKRLIELFELNDLSYEDCWFIIKSSAIINSPAGLSSGSNLPPAMEAMGKRMMFLCKGRPFVARALGGVLNSIEMKCDAEKELLKDDFMLPKKSKNEILAALKASYNSLPEPLQRCFLYCFLFPECHAFEKDVIVRLWMSQGFLDSQDGKIAEENGEEYCYELLMRSLLQVQRVGDANKEYFVMHDLVHDLKLLTSGEQILRIKDTSSCLIPDQVRHISVVTNQTDSVVDFVAFKECQALESLLLVERSSIHWAGKRIRILNPKVLEDLFGTLLCLKTLDLSFTNIRELPDSIKNLKGLCYLGLNSSNIRKLPDSICSLLRLQTLELQECACLHELPKGLKYLINLRHLDVWRRSGYVLLPTGIEHMTSLQSLSAFCVGEDNRHSGIGELCNLVNLRGHLRIGGLRHVAIDLDGSKANLQNKYNIKTLTLQWSSMGREIEIDDLKGDVHEVFKNLQPHPDIEEIIVRDYPGSYFPSWIGDPSFSTLISIVLDTCPRCELPPLGQLKSLCHLSILRMDGVQNITNKFRGNSINAFASLQTLKFHEIYNLELWNGVLEGDFPNLYNLTISRCFKLYGIPNFFSLKNLSITYSTKLSNLQGLPCLKELLIDNCSKLFCLQELFSLEELTVLNCPNIQYLQLLPSLGQLRIQNCQTIRHLQDLPCLRELSVQNCPELCSLHGLPLLQDLSIYNSPKMTEFHDLTCLRHLSIHYTTIISNLGNIPSLQFLRIEGILNEYLDLDFNLQELQILEVKCCSKLSHMMGLMSLKSLKKLKLLQCPKLQLGDLPHSLHFVEVHQSCSWLDNWLPLGFLEMEAILEWRWLVRE